jgi:polyphenol oxidase
MKQETRMSLEILRADELDFGPDGPRHGYFTRKGGASGSIYASLNCGVGSNDDAEAVAANRARVAKAVGVAPDRLLFVHQAHTADAVEADGPWPGGPPTADAMVTTERGLALGILTADCAPVLLADAEAGVIGAAHAGWRGALGGVLEAAVALMERKGARRCRIAAAVGPCISVSAYDVGEEFLERFMDEDPAYGLYFSGGPQGKPKFDLPRFCLDRLRDAGVADCGWIARCTYGDRERFYSYRRATHEAEGDYGRLASVIMLPEAG